MNNILEIPTYKFALREDLEKEGLVQFLPTKGEPNATGWDLRAAPEDKKDIVIKAGEFKLIKSGIKCYCPEGWWFEIRPRSSTFAKKHLNCLYGVIDEAFSLEILFAVKYDPDVKSLCQDLTIKFGEPLFQMIPIKRQEMRVELISNEEFNFLNTRRNADRKGGFGSTDKGK
jgi:dUTPase